MIARKGEALGVPTPVNRVLWALVSLREQIDAAEAFGNYGLLPPATQNYKPTATVSEVRPRHPVHCEIRWFPLFPVYTGTTR